MAKLGCICEYVYIGIDLNWRVHIGIDLHWLDYSTNWSKQYEMISLKCYIIYVTTDYVKAA